VTKGRYPPCDGCRNFRARTVPEWPSCKEQRLCERVDVDLLMRLPRQPIEAFDALSENIEQGHAVANLYGLVASFPSSVDVFLRFLKHLHAAIFRSAIPTIAGRFRSDGEDVEFGGEGGNRLRGSNPAAIEDELEHLFETCVRDGFKLGSLDAVAHRCALFLERFFRIHPFVDGNGRVGRLFVALACANTDVYVLPWKKTSEARRKYIKALEYAHRHAPGSTHGGYKACRQHTKYLALWILDHLLLRPPDEEMIEAGPPAGTDDKSSSDD
jgi:fido (protein-threonine AMPylation protein)